MKKESPEARRKRNARHTRYRKERHQAVAEARLRRGTPIPTTYDPTAPVLRRVVQGLKAPRIRTVLINGFPLTLEES